MIVSNNIEKTFHFCIYITVKFEQQLSKRQNKMWQVRTSNMRFLCSMRRSWSFSFIHFHLCIFFVCLFLFYFYRSYFCTYRAKKPSFYSSDYSQVILHQELKLVEYLDCMLHLHLCLFMLVAFPLAQTKSSNAPLIVESLEYIRSVYLVCENFGLVLHFDDVGFDWGEEELNWIYIHWLQIEIYIYRYVVCLSFLFLSLVLVKCLICVTGSIKCLCPSFFRHLFFSEFCLSFFVCSSSFFVYFANIFLEIG